MFLSPFSSRPPELERLAKSTSTNPLIRESTFTSSRCFVFIDFQNNSTAIKMRKMRTRKTPNTDTFHAFYISMPNEETRKISCYVK